MKNISESINEAMYLTYKDFANSNSWYDDRNNHTSYYDSDGREWIALSKDFKRIKGVDMFEIEAPSGAVVYLTKDDIITHKFKSRFN